MMRYRGVYVSGQEYAEGSVVTHSSTTWHCNVQTSDRPGTSDSWQMMAKSQGGGERRRR